MEIHEVIETFSRQFEKQACLSPFFRMQDFFLTFNTVDEKITVHLRKRSCNVILLMEDRMGDPIEIIGDTVAFHNLLKGRSKLTELVLKGELSIRAPYRILLKLESIFYLAGQQSRDAV